MKKGMLIVLSLLLSGCLYWGNGCWRPLIEVVPTSCVNKEPLPSIATYLKKKGDYPDTLKRMQDAESCGALKDDIYLTNITSDNFEKFDSCMQEKGYLSLTIEECVRNRSLCK